MLLQAVVDNSEQLAQTVDQLTESSLKLAEAAANFGALKVIFGIFLVFTLIMILLFLYQSVATTHKITKIHESSVKLEKYMEDSSSRTLGKGQASVLIRRSFNSLSQIVKYNILRTRIENHLDQRDNVTSKIANLVRYEYAELIAFLMNFECDDIELSESIKADDAQIIIDFMIEQVYMDSELFSVASMDQATDILLNGLKLEALKNFK